MIDFLKRNIVCAVIGHKLAYAGSCPFTGATYNYCETCHYMIPMEGIYD